MELSKDFVRICWGELVQGSFEKKMLT